MRLCNEGESCSEGGKERGARGGGSLRDGDESGAAEAQFASRVKRVGDSGEEEEEQGEGGK